MPSALSLIGLALVSASCPGSGAMPKAHAHFPPLAEALQISLATRFVADLEAQAPEDEAFAGPDLAVEPLPAEVLAAVPDDVWSEEADLGADEAATDREGDDASDERVARERKEISEERPRLASIARETWVYESPKHKSRRIGYLRAGSVVERSSKPETFAGCKGGFYAIKPRGYVCLGKTATLDPFHPVVEASKKRPRRDGLPYDYVMSRTPGPTMYARLPTEGEQGRAEPDLGYFKKKLKNIEKDPAFVPLPEAGPTLPALLYGQPLPGLGDAPPRDPSALVLGEARIRSGFALLAQFDHDGRRFGVTTDLAAIPLDRTRWVKPTTFAGIRLADELTLPIAFVMKKRATSFNRDEGGRMSPGDSLGHRQALGLTGKQERGFYETKEGSWVKADDIRVIESMSRTPTWARGERKWIDVSILDQSLVAYEGTRPVYVTLVSTGADGLGDPKETHSTVQGVFLIHTKHVTVTMDGDEAGDEFDLRDVPFVQYFNEGYALHAAYWHDDFGTPRSHGCVNLAPVDAAWLFNWTTPDVPETWHGALSLKHGTLVYTHP